ncbi:YIP1 family protein [Syntrophomonas erecta]
MISLSDTVYGVLFEPTSTFRQLSADRPYGQALLVYLLVMALSLFINTGITREIYYTGSWEAQLFKPVVGTLIALIFLLTISGILSLLSEILYKKGNAGGLVVCLGYATLPGILGPSVQLGAYIAGISWLAVGAPILAGGWVLILQVVALREALDIKSSQAIILFLLPVVLLLILIVSAFMGIISMFM